MTKRSNAPDLLGLFGAGGMLSALFGPMLVLITGMPCRWACRCRRICMSYPRMLAFAQNWIGKGFLFFVISLFAWHAAHRIFYSLHDLRRAHRPAPGWYATAARSRDAGRPDRAARARLLATQREPLLLLAGTARFPSQGSPALNSSRRRLCSVGPRHPW